MRFTIVSDRGVRYRVEGFDHLVLRRREVGRTHGSEVAVFRNHGPLLMQTCECEARLVYSDRTVSVHAPQGVTEVLDDNVTLVLT